jgi:ankyrin repeat protein
MDIKPSKNVGNGVKIIKMSLLFGFIATGCFGMEEVPEEEVAQRNAEIEKNSEALRDAAYKGDAAEVQRLLQLKEGAPDVNVPNKDGLTPLLIASIAPKDDEQIKNVILKLLQIKDIDLNRKDGAGMTALINAARTKKPKTALALVNAGADVTQHSTAGSKSSALKYAVKNYVDTVDYNNLIQALLAKGADINELHPLLLTNFQRLPEAAAPVQEKVATGGGGMVFVDESEEESRPELSRAESIVVGPNELLINAAKAGNLNKLITLLKSDEDGASADYKDSHGYTALLYAVKGGFPEIVELLLGRSEAEINGKVNGKNALELALAGFNTVTDQALKQNYLRMIGLLLLAGIKVPEEFQTQARTLLDAAVTYFDKATSDEQKQHSLNVIITLQRAVPLLMSPAFSKNSGALLESAAHYLTQPGQATFNLRLQQEKYLNFIADFVRMGIQTPAFKKLAPAVLEVAVDNFIKSRVDPVQQKIDRDLIKSLLLLETPLTDKVKAMSAKIIEKAADYFVTELNAKQQKMYRDFIALLLNDAGTRKAVVNNAAAINALNKAFGYVEANKLLLLRELTPAESKRVEKFLPDVAKNSGIVPPTKPSMPRPYF